MELKGIKGIDTFVQNTEPSTKYSGDVWIRPGKQSKLVWSRDKWNRPFWKDVVSKILWGAGCEYGYIFGIYDGTDYYLNIIDFPFDSGIVSSRLDNRSESTCQSCNSSNYGYHIVNTNINRFSFPFDSGSLNYVGNLANSHSGGSALNSSNYGYICGGYDSDYSSIIDRITFPFDSGTATHVGNMSRTRTWMAGCNSSVNGYMFGGIVSNVHYSIIDRFSFPFDSGTATYVGNLSETRNYAAQAFNSSNYGYCCGGLNSVKTEILSTVDRIAFPFDSGTAIHVGNMTQTRYTCACCNSSKCGYVCGGYNGYTSVLYSTIDSITFPFDSGIATHVGNLNVATKHISGTDGVDFVTMFV